MDEKDGRTRDDLAQTKYPFATTIIGNDYIDEHNNRIEKVRAYYERRQFYDKIVLDNPAQRLATDKRKVEKPESEKVARADRSKPPTIVEVQQPKIKKDEQLGLF